jgi:hypothetical protein
VAVTSENWGLFTRLETTESTLVTANMRSFRRPFAEAHL